MFSMVLPMVSTRLMSPPLICTSLPKLIMSPAAGITAMTVIRTFPNFWRKSKSMGNFLFFPAGFSVPSGFPVPFGFSLLSGFPAAGAGQSSRTVISSDVPPSTGPR